MLSDGKFNLRGKTRPNAPSGRPPGENIPKYGSLYFEIQKTICIFVAKQNP